MPITLPDDAAKVRNSEGFTWTKLTDPQTGKRRWLMPEDLGYIETIGWAAVAFAERWLQLNNSPLELTNEQIRQLLWINALRETEDGEFRWAFPLSVITRIKGTGKDMIQAIMCLFELCGNARPARDEDGVLRAVPVERPPWIIVAATSLESTSTTSLYFKQLLTDEAIEHFGIDLGKELTFSARGGRLESVTSNYRRIEGQRPTFQTGTEAGLWVKSNQGVDMFEAMERGAAKDPMSRVLLSSNAYAVGQGSVLEKVHSDYIDIQTGRMVDTGLNYDSLSAPADTDVTDPASLRRGIDEARGDAHWLDVERKLQVALSKRTSVENTLRFELNIPAASDDALYTQLDWDSNKDEALRLEPGDRITLGMDVSLRDDATALVACRIEDRAMFLLELEERKPGDSDEWQVDVGIFDRAIEEAFGTYDVVGFFSDVNPIQGHIVRYEQEYGDRLQVRFNNDNTVGADMRGSIPRFTRAHEMLMAGILDGEVLHNGDLDLRRHVLNAYKRPNRSGLSFGKESKYSHKKVDAYAAMLLADMARSEYIANAPKPKRRRAVVFR